MRECGEMVGGQRTCSSRTQVCQVHLHSHLNVTFKWISGLDCRVLKPVASTKKKRIETLISFYNGYGTVKPFAAKKKQDN